MINKIESLKAEIAALTASSAAEAEQLRIKYLSKKGEVTQLFTEFKTLPAEQKRELGARLNELKNFATERINTLKEAAGDNVADADLIDLSRTPAPMPLGTP